MSFDRSPPLRGHRPVRASCLLTSGLVVLSLALGAGCATRVGVGHAARSVPASPATPDPKSHAGASSVGHPQVDSSATERVVELPTLVVRPDAEPDVVSAFEEARAALSGGACARAVELFAPLVLLRPDSGVVAPSLYNQGIALACAGEKAAGVHAWLELARLFPDDALAHPARLRALRTLVYLERWGEIGPLLDVLQGRGQAPVLEQVELRGARALAALEAGDDRAASVELQRASSALDAAHLDDPSLHPVELAVLHYARGELLRRQAKARTFAPSGEGFAATLEDRCTLLLQAQGAYSDVMRSRDPHWSTLAGFRVGQLYETLHTEVLEASPPPETPSAASRQLFEGALHLRYRVLLEKGLKLMQSTVRLVERSGESSPWADKVRLAESSLAQKLAAENELLASSPYTEAQLRQALDELQTRRPSTAPR